MALPGFPAARLPAPSGLFSLLSGSRTTSALVVAAALVHAP